LSNLGEFASTAHWVNRTDLCPSSASARTNVTRPCGELAREARKLDGRNKNGHAVLLSMAPCSLPSVTDTGPVKKIRSCTQNALAWGQGAKRECLIRGNLLDRSDYFVKFGRALLVLGEHDVDLCIGRNGDDNTAVGVEAHDFGITSCANVLGKPLPEHIVL